MSGQSEVESKVASCIEKALGESLSEQPHLKKLIKQISLENYSFSESLPGAVVVGMPNELLINLKLAYSKVVSSIKKIFPGQVVLFKRDDEIVLKKGIGVNHTRELILSDLVFPAQVTGRSTVVESKAKMFQKVYLDGSQEFWSPVEKKTLEAVLNKVLNDEYTISVFTPSN